MKTVTIIQWTQTLAKFIKKKKLFPTYLPSFFGPYPLNLSFFFLALSPLLTSSRIGYYCHRATFQIVMKAALGVTVRDQSWGLLPKADILTTRITCPQRWILTNTGTAAKHSVQMEGNDGWMGRLKTFNGASIIKTFFLPLGLKSLRESWMVIYSSWSR